MSVCLFAFITKSEYTARSFPIKFGMSIICFMIKDKGIDYDNQ